MSNQKLWNSTATGPIQAVGRCYPTPPLNRLTNQQTRTSFSTQCKIQTDHSTRFSGIHCRVSRHCPSVFGRHCCIRSETPRLRLLSATAVKPRTLFLYWRSTDFLVINISFYNYKTTRFIVTRQFNKRFTFWSFYFPLFIHNPLKTIL